MSEIRAIQIACGDYHSLALLSDGTVVGWGLNADDEITIPDFGGIRVTQIAGGAFYSLALLDDGRVVGWGDNTYRQTTIPDFGGIRVTQIAGGYTHSLALLSDGTVVGWGDNSNGQITIPDFGRKRVTQIACGSLYSLALLDDGSVVGWGSNDSDQLNIPDFRERRVIQIACGVYHSLALLDDGSVRGWGDNRNGQINIPGYLSAGLGIDTSISIGSSGTVSAGPGVATSTEQRVINTQDCGICFHPKKLSLHDVGDKTVQFLPCGHTFHKGCINSLIMSGRNKECPYCKKGFGGFKGIREGPANLLYDTHTMGTDEESVFILDICDICKKHKDFNAEGIEKLQVLTCGHVYHRGCITDRMAVGDNKCPKCRKPFGESKDIFYGGSYDESHLMHKYLKYKQKYLRLKNKH